MKVKIAVRTDIGKVRENNEDAYIVCSDLTQQMWKSTDMTACESTSYVPLNKYGALLVVADGMGGANAGEVASSIAISKVKEIFSRENIELYLSGNNIKGLLEFYIREANDAVNRRIWDDPSTSGMGTTIVICWLIRNEAHIAWCGDSRCYVYNPYDGLAQLTKDHSLVQELVDNGKLTEKEAFTHPDSSIITRGLGNGDLTSVPDTITYTLKSNDIILLCSDGLCGYCTNKEIGNIMLSNYNNVCKTRDELMKLALTAGGYDNISIAVASIISNEQIEPVSLSFMRRFFLTIKHLLN